MGHASWRDAAVRATDLPLSPGEVAANAAGTAPQPRHVLRHAGAVRWFTHTGKYFDHRQIRRVHITANGRALYREEFARYRELYPDVDAPEPSAQLVHGG